MNTPYKPLNLTMDIRIGKSPNIKPDCPHLNSSQEVYDLTKKYAKADREIMLLVMVGGIARGEVCFLPRVTGWAKAKKSYPSSYLRKGEKP